MNEYNDTLKNFLDFTSFYTQTQHTRLISSFMRWGVKNYSFVTLGDVAVRYPRRALVLQNGIIASIVLNYLLLKLLGAVTVFIWLLALTYGSMMWPISINGRRST